MPPSGYTRSESQFIVGFLTSCAHALRDEAIQGRLDPNQALSRECANITQILEDNSQLPIQISVLRLTLTFYEMLLRAAPLDFREFEMAVERTSAKVSESVLAIHVPASQP